MAITVWRDSTRWDWSAGARRLSAMRERNTGWVELSWMKLNLKFSTQKYSCVHQIAANSWGTWWGERGFFKILVSWSVVIWKCPFLSNLPFHCTARHQRMLHRKLRHRLIARTSRLEAKKQSKTVRSSNQSLDLSRKQSKKNVWQCGDIQNFLIHQMKQNKKYFQSFLNYS